MLLCITNPSVSMISFVQVELCNDPIANWTLKEVMHDFIVHLCGYLIDLGTIASVADVEQIP